ncbi:ARMT1-like domain-containing protein, partial [Chloroflexota bacterium]
TDNSGMELLFDLAVADFLLGTGWARQVVMHLKPHPYFVSDAMPSDVVETLALLEPEPLGARLAEHQSSGRLLLESHPFWSGCHMMRQMPTSLAALLQVADLVILKGDVNYRRLLDDLHWPHTERLEDIASYFPSSFVALRTLKGEIMVGLKPGQAERLAEADPDWLINGRRGIIHLVQKPS